MNFLKSVKAKTFKSKNNLPASAANESNLLSNVVAVSLDNSEVASVMVIPPESHDSCASAVQLSISRGSFNFDYLADRRSNQTQTLAFPELFHEANDMLYLSNLIYVLTEVRDLARNRVLNNPMQSLHILELPMPLDTISKIILQEGELLKEVLNDGEHETTLSALESVLGNHQKLNMRKNVEANDQKSDDNSMFGWMKNWDGCLAGGFSFDELFCGGDLGTVDGGLKTSDVYEVDSSMIAAVGDLKSNEELVYAVGVNPVEERVTVIFRGSVTKADFVTEARIALILAPDPRKFNGTKFDNSHINVGVHQGCYEYLLGEEGGNPSKYLEIMKIVEQLLADHPTRRNYKLYVTGHSLGGALATLFGFYAAASSLVPLPVTVVSVASPRVGNFAFALTFAEMESQGKIRHLRIANHRDPVTLGPTISSKQALGLSAKAVSPLGYTALMVAGNGQGGEEEVYYHTGIKMKLFKNISSTNSQRYHLSYSGLDIIARAKKLLSVDYDKLAELEQSKRKMAPSKLPVVSCHYSTAYSDRLALVESDIKGLTLNTVYREKACDFVSWVTS
jgi:hypothetical protein